MQHGGVCTLPSLSSLSIRQRNNNIEVSLICMTFLPLSNAGSQLFELHAQLHDAPSDYGVGKFTEYLQSSDPLSMTVNSYPGDVPDGTAVPAWAYQNITVRSPLKLHCVLTRLTSLLQSMGLFNLSAASIVAAEDGDCDSKRSKRPS